MVFSVESTGESFKYSNGKLQPLENKNVLPKGYIFNQDKMPLMEQRYGFLPDKLNALLLNSSNNSLDGEVRLDSNVFLRKGVEKNNKYSFISAIGSYFKMSAVELVKHILKHLTLADFIRINNGDLVKYFSLNVSKEDIPVNILSNFLENPENATLLQKINASPEQKNTLCYAFNYFKKYLGNMNISKDYKMLWHMFSVPLDLSQSDKLPLLKNGLNIIIIEKKIVNENETLSILNPPRADHYSKNKNTIILFKFNDYFEPVVLRSVTGGHSQGGLKEVFIKYFRFDTDLLPDKFNYDGNALILSKMYSNLKKILSALEKMSKRNVKQSGSLVYDRLPTISEVTELVKMGKLSVNKLVIDNFIKGVGVLVNCLETKKLIYIETREFNPLKITIKNNLIKLDNFNKIENDNKIKLKDLMESYNSLSEGTKLSVRNIVVNEGKIIAAVNNLGTKVILEPQVYDKAKVDIPLYTPSLNFKLFISEEEMDKKGIKLNKDDTLKYVKHSFSQIMSNPRNKSFLNKVNQIIKEDIADNIKRSKLNKIFNVVVNGICGSSKTLVIYGENVIFEECNILKINKHPKLSQIITEDIMRSKLKRNELLSGTFSNPKFEKVKGRIIDEDDFLLFVDRHFSNNNNIYQFIDNTYSDLSKKTKDKQLLDIIPDIPETVPEIIHNKKTIIKSVNAKISPDQSKTKRCVFPFKYKDMIYKNCINYRELGPQPVCAIDTKGKNKYGTCPGESIPVSQLKSFTKTKMDSNNRNNNSNSDKFYSVKPKLSKKITVKSHKEKSVSGKEDWVGPFKNMEVSDKIKGSRKKYHTLEDAIKEAERINKDGIKYDSIVKIKEKHFQLRQAYIMDEDKEKKRDLWLLKSEKERIMAVKPKKKTIRVRKPPKPKPTAIPVNPK